MDWWIIGILLFSGLFVLIASGIHIAFALFFVALVTILFMWGPRGWLVLAANSFSSLTNYLLLAAPMFILMGICIEVSGLGADAFRAVEMWLGGYRGGLATSTVAAATVFGAATGFSGTGVAAFGPVALPEMAKRKYDPGLAMGALGGGSALAVLIPPSIPFVYYGFLSGVSISKLFIAGIIPGIVGSVLFMIYIYVRVRLNPRLAPVSKMEVPWRRKLVDLWRILPLAVLILSVLGSLWGGMATPTEAAALGSFVALLMVVLYGRFSWPRLKQILLGTVEVTAKVFAIIMGAFAFTQVLSYSGFVSNFSEWLISLSVSPWIVLALMMLANLFLGCFLDTTAILFLTLPIYLPVAEKLGFDMIWFGVLIVINTEIGCLTPPVGMNLFVLQGVAPREWDYASCILGVAPYWFLYLFLMIFVALVPGLAVWLPHVLSS